MISDNDHDHEEQTSERRDDVKKISDDARFLR